MSAKIAIRLRSRDTVVPPLSHGNDYTVMRNAGRVTLAHACLGLIITGSVKNILYKQNNNLQWRQLLKAIVSSLGSHSSRSTNWWRS